MGIYVPVKIVWIITELLIKIGLKDYIHIFMLLGFSMYYAQIIDSTSREDNLDICKMFDYYFNSLVEDNLL